MPRLPLPPLQLSLQWADPRHRDLLPRHTVQRTLRAAAPYPAEFTVRVVGVDEGQALNLAWRRQDHATNVLTFPYTQPPSKPSDVVIADVVLCAAVVQAEAEAQGKALKAHYVHLLVHGALHAMGWDHETSEADAIAMEAQEIQVLARLGWPSPYA